MTRLLVLPLACCLATPTFATELLTDVAAGKDGGGGRDMIVWNNGDTDGSAGYSNADPIAFGYRRTLLDDFTITRPRPIWRLCTYQIWDTLPVGSGNDFTLSFRIDAGGEPGGVIWTVSTIDYEESATGRYWFGRPEYRMEYYFDEIILGPGTYWIEGNVVGPEDNFWMVTSTINGSPCWVDYEDHNGLEPGRNVYGEDADLAFYLTGFWPEPATLTLLTIGALALLRRR